MDWQALISSQPSLAQLPSALQESAELRNLRAGEVLARVGDQVNWVFSIISGEVRLIRRSYNGAEVILQRSRGGFIAEASLSSKTYHCDMVVAEQGAVLRFPINAFRASLDKEAEFRDAWTDQLAREVRKLRAQCERLSLHGAAERIMHYIETEGVEGVLELSQSRKAWAAELGLTHEALYRTLSRLQAEGELVIEDRRIAVARTRRTA